MITYELSGLNTKKDEHASIAKVCKDAVADSLDNKMITIVCIRKSSQY